MFIFKFSKLADSTRRCLKFEYDDDNSSKNIDNDNCIIEFVKMVYLIEERLPYLSLIKILNNHNIVTQNVSLNPDILQMLSLNFVSVPTFFSNMQDFDLSYNKNLESTSKKLWNSVTSFTIRQKQFKDYLNTALPIISFGKGHSSSPSSSSPSSNSAKFIFIVEFTFNHSILKDDFLSAIDENNSQNIEKISNKINVQSMSLEANSLESLYQSIRLEWISMCKMYELILELKRALRKYPDMQGKIHIKKINLRQLTLKYGPQFAYTIQLNWSKETKSYDLVLGVDMAKSGSVSKVDEPLTNYHMLFWNEIKRYFAQTNYSIINLLQMLDCTCTSLFALAKLSNLPKFYSRISNQPIVAKPGFMIIFCSLTHIRLIYYSRYCLDIHIMPNGLVSVRDGAFGLTDINTTIDELNPIQFLSVKHYFIFYFRANT
jgi:hypothetical protein